MPSAAANVAYLLTLSPLVLTVLLSLAVNPAEAASAVGHIKRHHGARSPSRGSLAAKRDAGAFDVVEPRGHVSVRRKRDGTHCKVRVNSSMILSSTNPAAAAPTQEQQPAAPASSAPAAAPTASSAAPAPAAAAPAESSAPPAPAPAPVEPSSTYVAPEPTTTTEAPAYVAPTTTQAPVYVEPTPAPAPAPEPTPTPIVNTPVNTGVRKAGLAWPNGNSNNPQRWADLMGASWYYTWSPWPVTQLTNQEFVPMLWGWKQVGDWQANIQTYKGLGVKNALFVNEPNGAGQANMDVGSGCKLWFEQFEQLRSIVPGIQLGSAGPDSAPSGKQWLIDFRNQCAGANPDFYHLHWYDTTYEHFQAYVLDFAATFQKPLWVTEYACQNFNGGAQCDWNYVHNEFFQGTTAWMNGRPEVARYSAFGAMLDMQGVNTANALMGGDSLPTEYGRKYIESH